MTEDDDGNDGIRRGGRTEDGRRRDGRRDGRTDGHSTMTASMKRDGTDGQRTDEDYDGTDIHVILIEYQDKRFRLFLPNPFQV